VVKNPVTRNTRIVQVLAVISSKFIIYGVAFKLLICISFAVFVNNDIAAVKKN